MTESQNDNSVMDLRTKICIAVILVGLANFLAYTISYSILYGEAINGSVKLDEKTGDVVYMLQSDKQVSRGQFLYSGIHSITIWPTVMAIMLSLLTLAKDRISDTMHSTVVRGRSLCTILAVLIAISTAGMTFLFVRQFTSHLEEAEQLRNAPSAAEVQPHERP
jgi:hypothetical protein